MSFFKALMSAWYRRRVPIDRLEPTRAVHVHHRRDDLLFLPAAREHALHERNRAVAGRTLAEFLRRWNQPMIRPSARS